MRKVISILLAVILVVAFAGCSEGGNGGNGGNGGGAGNNADYSSLKDVSRTCVDAINNGFSGFSDYYDDSYYSSDAAKYMADMTKGNDLLTAAEYIFSGDEKDAKRSLKEALYLTNPEYTVDHGTAVATGTGIDGEDAKVVVKYDGEKSGQVEYYANGTLTRTVSFVNGDGYNAVMYYDNDIITVNAVYSNGDVYFAFDPNCTSQKTSFLENPSLPSNKFFVTNGRDYIAIEGGKFVNSTAN